MLRLFTKILFTFNYSSKFEENEKSLGITHWIAKWSGESSHRTHSTQTEHFIESISILENSQRAGFYWHSNLITKIIDSQLKWKIVKKKTKWHSQYYKVFHSLFFFSNLSRFQWVSGWMLNQGDSIKKQHDGLEQSVWLKMRNGQHEPTCNFSAIGVIMRSSTLCGICKEMLTPN